MTITCPLKVVWSFHEAYPCFKNQNRSSEQKIFIFRTNPSITYQLWNKNTIDCRGFRNITTKIWKIDYREIIRWPKPATLWNICSTILQNICSTILQFPPRFYKTFAPRFYNFLHDFTKHFLHDFTISSTILQNICSTILQFPPRFYNFLHDFTISSTILQFSPRFYNFLHDITISSTILHVT